MFHSLCGERDCLREDRHLGEETQELEQLDPCQDRPVPNYRVITILKKIYMQNYYPDAIISRNSPQL